MAKELSTTSKTDDVVIVDAALGVEMQIEAIRGKTANNTLKFMYYLLTTRSSPWNIAV